MNLIQLNPTMIKEEKLQELRKINWFINNEANAIIYGLKEERRILYSNDTPLKFL